MWRLQLEFLASQHRMMRRYALYSHEFLYDNFKLNIRESNELDSSSSSAHFSKNK